MQSWHTSSEGVTTYGGLKRRTSTFPLNRGRRPSTWGKVQHPSLKIKSLCVRCERNTKCECVRDSPVMWWQAAGGRHYRRLFLLCTAPLQGLRPCIWQAHTHIYTWIKLHFYPLDLRKLSTKELLTNIGLQVRPVRPGRQTPPLIHCPPPDTHMDWKEQKESTDSNVIWLYVYPVKALILARRLKMVLDSIIEETQLGFMSGRHIMNNIRQVLDILD